MGILETTALKGLRGKLGKELVFKRYGDKIVVTKYPDMSRVKRSPRQKESIKKFKEAVRYAKEILRDEKKRKAFAKKLRPDKSVYHAAIAEYMNKR